MNRKTFERLIEEQRPRLVRVAAGIVGEHAAADVVQIAIAQAWRDGDWKTQSYNDGSRDLTVHVQGDAKNHLEAEQRSQEREAMFTARLPHDEGERDDAIDVRYAMTKLPEEIRAAVFAVVIEGATEAEFAVEIGVNQSTVHRRVKRGLELLRDALNGTAARIQEA